MASTTTNVIIIPGMVSSMCTALRGHINTSASYYRMNRADLMEDELKALRRDLTRYETYLRQTCKED